MRKLLFAFLFLANTAQAAPLNDAAYLRKMSFHIRGFAPDPIEYQELKAAQGNGSLDAFFETKAEAYLKSSEHAKKLRYRLEELFRLSPAGLTTKVDNSASAMMMSLAEKNLPWDTLLVGKQYVAYPAQDTFFRITDFGFFGAIAPNQVPAVSTGTARRLDGSDVKDPVDVVFGDSESRVAGVLTTARFFERYTTTALNKNRKRAAAVFRIFLCDSMMAAVPPAAENQDDLFDRAFPGSSVTKEEMEKLLAAGDKHGGDQACAKCHYKLDPLGKAFMGSDIVLGPRSSPGQLVFHNSQNQLVQIPGNGLGDVALAVSQQPEYVSCQTRYFWNWFIGKDRTLSTQRHEELNQAFEKVGRRTNDFIAYLLAAPEFREIDHRTPEEVRAATVKGILQNCDSCHSPKNAPAFAQWPIGGDTPYWVDRISKRLDLDHDGANATMPPSYSPWKPSVDELRVLKSWIQDGAPNEKGEKQI